MSKIGFGYGSEWHLLRYLGYHRDCFTQKIMSEVPAFQNTNIHWLDNNFSISNDRFCWDLEHKGIEIFSDKGLNEKWNKYWPSTGNVQNWDAVGVLYKNASVEYVFVEAKAHLNELKSECKASQDSKDIIKSAFQETISYYSLNKAKADNWLMQYYQFANRLAFLHFLQKQNFNAHLLFLYFYGDDNQHGKCPLHKNEWEAELLNMYSHMGIDGGKISKNFYDRVHKVYLSTNPKVL